MRRIELEALRKGKPALGKTAYMKRVKSVLRSKKAQEVAKAKFNALKKVCCEVVKKNQKEWS